jgi:hypothetical protein
MDVRERFTWRSPVSGLPDDPRLRVRRRTVRSYLVGQRAQGALKDPLEEGIREVGERPRARCPGLDFREGCDLPKADTYVTLSRLSALRKVRRHPERISSPGVNPRSNPAVCMWSTFELPRLFAPITPPSRKHWICVSGGSAVRQAPSDDTVSRGPRTRRSKS